MQIPLTRTEAQWGNRYLLFQLIFLPSLVRLVLGCIWPSATDLHLNLICWGINFFVICGIFHRFLLESAKDAVQNVKTILLTALTGFMVYWVANIALSLVLVLLFPDFYNVNNANIADVARENLLLTAVGTVVLVPIVEEVFYRGLVFGLLRRHSRILAYAVSVMVFSAIHITGYIGHYEPLHLLLCTLQYLPPSLVLAYCYDRTGNIFAPTLIHITVNAIAMLSMR